jgi:hypothetical protein
VFGISSCHSCRLEKYLAIWPLSVSAGSDASIFSSDSLQPIHALVFVQTFRMGKYYPLASGRIYYYNNRLLFVSCLSVTVIIICVGFFLYWYFLGHQYNAVMLRLSPLVLFVLLSNATFLLTIRTRLHQTWLSSGLLQSIHGYYSKYKALEIMIVALS